MNEIKTYAEYKLFADEFVTAECIKDENIAGVDRDEYIIIPETKEYQAGWCFNIHKLFDRVFHLNSWLNELSNDNKEFDKFQKRYILDRFDAYATDHPEKFPEYIELVSRDLDKSSLSNSTSYTPDDLEIRFSRRRDDNGKLAYTPDDFIIDPVHIGKGGFGVVFKACLKDDPLKRTFALKVIEKFERAQREVEVYNYILQRSREGGYPENILRFFGWFKFETRGYVVLEYVSGGDFKDYIQKNTLSAQHYAYFKQLCQAVKWCHEHDICHRDIKPQNALIDSFGNRAILMDFDMAVIGDELNNKKMMTTFCGTPNFIARDIIETKSTGKPYTRSIDIWSLGVMLFVIAEIEHRPPFQSTNVQRTLQNIAARRVDPSFKLVDKNSELIFALMCTLSPAKRATLDEVIGYLNKFYLK